MADYAYLVAALVDLVRALAWPIATVVIVVIMRQPLVDLIARVRRWKGEAGPWKFEMEVAEIQQDAIGVVPLPPIARAAVEPGADARAPESAQPTALLGDNDYFGDAARFSILRAFAAVEAAALDMLQRKGISAPQTGRSLRKAILASNLLTASQVELFTSLQRLRNDAAHAREVELTTKAVLSYLDVAAGLVEVLKST